MDTKDTTTRTTELEYGLLHFSGTVNYYRHFSGLKYTDGIKYLAEQAQSYWLIDLIASYQSRKVRAEFPFQIWTLTVDLDEHQGTIKMQEDSDAPVEIQQPLPYTDFPLASFSCYLIDGVLMLKSEY